MAMYKLVVAANGFNGPDLFFVKVDCSQEDYDLGKHYDGAEAWASNQGFEAPYIVFDENDPPKAIFDLFLWESASVVDIHGEEIKN